MLTIGLTGGIGCGKSTVCRLFEALDVPIVDADLIARQLVDPGQPALQDIVAAFGSAVLHADGSLDRAALRAKVFADPEQKCRLEAILHPLVYTEIARQVEGLTGSYVIVAVPLLLETDGDRRVDRVLVVDCPPKEQLQRVLARDGLAIDQARAIIASQLSREARLARADDVLDNGGDPERLAEQVKSLHNSYNLLASVRTPTA